MIDFATFADMQADAVSLALTSVCSISRPTLVDDGQGGNLETWAVIAPGVPCSVVGITSGAQVAAQTGRVVAVTSWLINVPVDTDVTAKDRIVVGTGTYEVVDILGEPGALILTLPLQCREVR